MTERRHISSPLCRGSFLAGTLLCCACGSGLDDGAGSREVSKVLGSSGGDIVLSQGRFTFSPDSLAGDTTVTVRRMPTGLAGGALGAVFEVEMPSGVGLGTQDPEAAIAVTKHSDRDHVRLGFLPVTDAVEGPRYWIPVQESEFDAAEIAVRGPMAAFRERGNVVQFAAVYTCATTDECPRGRDCQAGACQ